MSNKRDALGDRMKNYENVTRIYLEPKKPIIVRIDGRAFHTYTKGFIKPFDDIMIASMEKTLQTLCEEVGGVLFGYTQSDEITLVLGDWQKDNTQSFFNGNILKIASVTASIATLAFNKAIIEEVHKAEQSGIDISRYKKALNMTATFDSRCFNLPFEEVINCCIWRQQDAIRNSKQAVGYANFSYKETFGLNCDELVEKLKEEKGIIWNEFPIYQQRGILCEKVDVTEEISYVHKKTGEKNTSIVTRHKWILNHNMPLFSEDREKFEKMLLNAI